MQDKTHGLGGLVDALSKRTPWALMLEMVENRIADTTEFKEGVYNHADPTAYKEATVYIGFLYDPHAAGQDPDCGSPSPACYTLKYKNVTWGTDMTLTRYTPDFIEEPPPTKNSEHGGWSWVWDTDYEGNPPLNVFNGTIYLDADRVRDQAMHDLDLKTPTHKALYAFLTYALCGGQWYSDRKAYERDNALGPVDAYEEHYGRNV